MRKTRIIATIGPACDDVKTLKALISGGVNVCRLNFSFGTHEYHRKNIDAIRRISNQLGKSVAIMQDLQGPKIRIGNLTAPVTLQKNDRVILSGHTIHKTPLYLPTTYRNIAADTKPGKTILLADGRIILSVENADVAKREVHCRVLNGGTVLTGKGINLPYTDISMPALTPKDLEDAEFGIAAGVDYLALSFVRTAGDVLRLKRLIKKRGANIPVVAKIEKPEALDNLEEILEAVDGVMVARGDLADEISFEHVPTAQKRIIRDANAMGKLSIVATEMLSSMTENPLPSRAEVSDVANAVIDGADMVMLSNETAAGKHPNEAVKAMAAIAAEAELMPVRNDGELYRPADAPLEPTHAMCLSASFLSRELNARAIVVLTSSGETARILAKCRPLCPIYAATYHEPVYRRMAAFHNVLPLLLTGPHPAKSNQAHRSYDQISEQLLEKKLAKHGDRLIVLAGINGKDNQWRLNEIQLITL